MKKQANGWLIASLAGAVVVLLPIFSILASLFQKPNENWQQIQQYMMKDYVRETLLLVLGTACFTMLIGVALAWLVAAYDFPFKKFFHWSLALPLAVPPYIAAYTYSTMLSYTGVVQTTLRSQFGLKVDPKWFDIMSLQGAVFIFSLFLFPYVYLITRSFLERQSGSYIENAWLLGRKPASIFLRVALPLARPAIVGGVTLVIFEVISDYGVTSYFGVQTFSTAIFHTWFGMYDVDSAVRLAAWLMVGLIGVFIAERLLRRSRSFSSTTAKSNPLAPIRLRGIYALGAFLLCSAVFAVSFLIPVIQLIVWATWSFQDVMTPAFLRLTMNTVSVALIATVIIMAVSVIVANVSRLQKNAFSFVLSKMVTAGYSIPGAILAIGVLVMFIWIDQALAPVYNQMGLGQTPLVLSMSIVMLIFAFVVRFMATGYNAVDAGFEKVGNKYTEASRMLGNGITKTFFKVDLFMIKGAILSGAVLTFVELIKELPLTLLLRPFNFDTLATKTYQYANDERIFQASVPALFIVVVSVISVYAFHQLGKKWER